MTGYNFTDVEREMKEFWKKIDLLRILELKNKEGERYFLLDGPPYANFVPHIGHIRNTVYKDLYVRWSFMKGNNVLFQPGFDTHGLPIENMVEKKMGIKSKKDIKKIGIPKFMKECKDSAALNKDLWMDVYDRLGSYYSCKEPYLTYNNSYIESAWWSFRQIWNKNLVYEGKKPVHWCPKCQTALAGYETTDSYKNVTDPSIYLKFKLKDSDEHVLVYTTTPWTLPANVAIAANPEADYAVVDTTAHGKLIIAEKQLKLLTELGIGFTLIKTIKGKELQGKRYESLLEELPTQKELLDEEKALQIYMSIPILKERVSSKVAMKKGIQSGDIYEDFVSDEEGTGFVHIAPGHGKTDNEIGKHFGLPEVSPVDDECKFTEDAGKYQGIFVKEADHDIAEDIHKSGKLLHYDKIEHNYPLCWRCKSPLIFRLSNQWFIRIQDIKEKMLEANEKVNWQPDFAKERFHEWVANAEDWNFSRQRFWGIPIPIWKCECGNNIVIESIKDLQAQGIGDIPDDFDLHNASEIKVLCSCGKKAERISDIFDVWFDSGCAPYSSVHYPFENKEKFEDHYPVSRINESQDQIRGWFYSLMCNGIAVFDKAPYETVSMPGWVLDEKGEKMSKSLGNVIWAKEGIEEMGADQIRFYYCWDINPAYTQKFNKAIIRNEVQKYFSVFWNMHKLLFSAGCAMKEPKMDSPEDKWIISRLNSVIEYTRDSIESFRLHNSGRMVFDFIVNDLSRTYIQLVRDRMANDMNPYFIANKCMIEILKLTASITPFFSEKMYQVLKDINTSLSEKSVHLESIPELDKTLVDKALEDEFEILRDTIAAILSAREKAQLGVRWPVKTITILPNDDNVKAGIEKYSELIKVQANVKDILFKDTMPEVKNKISAEYSRLGPDYGDITPQIITKITTESAGSILRKLRKDGEYKFKVDDREVVLKKEHLKIEKEVPEGLVESEFEKGVLYLDTFRTEDLESEGFARELMRRVQSLRKKAGMEKSDVINLFVKCDEDLSSYFTNWQDAIKSKVGADTLKISENQPSKEHEHTSDEKVKGKEFSIYFSKC